LRPAGWLPWWRTCPRFWRIWVCLLSRGSPRDPHMVSDILGVVDVILERMKEAYDFGHDPWD
jgi:hypothetical protein